MRNIGTVTQQSATNGRDNPIHAKQQLQDTLSLSPPGIHLMSPTHPMTRLLGCLEHKSSSSSLRTVFAEVDMLAASLESTGVVCTGEDRRMTLWNLIPSGCAQKSPHQAACSQCR